MWIYLAYIFITLIAYYAFIGGSKPYIHNSGIVVQRKRIYFSWVAGILLWVIFAFRDVSVGSDTINYFERYSNIQKPEVSLLSIAGQEWGYDLLQYLCHSIGMSWQVYLSFISVIIILPMVIFFHKYSTNVWSSFFLYITIGLLDVNMSALRQSLAVAMVVWALMAMFERKHLRSLLFILIGTLFHYSAFFALLLFLVPLFKYNSKRQLTLLLLVPILARVVGYFFLGSLENLMPVRYLDSYSEEKTMNPLLEAVWISILLFIFFSLRINGKVKSDEFQLYFLVVLYVSSIELSYSVYLASRLAYYFEPAVMVAMPMAMMKFRNKETRAIISVVIHSLCFAFLIISSYGSDTLAIYNYHFFWQ